MVMGLTREKAAAALLLGSLAVAACASNDELLEQPLPDPGLSARALYLRASLDVRGARPSAAELEQLEQSPDQLNSMLAALLDDPRFGSRAAAVFAPALRTRRDRYRFGAEDYGLPSEQNAALQQAFSEEALNLIHYIAVTDRPFSEILTADYTIVAPILTQVWPLATEAEQPSAGLPEATQLARYQDGRPAAGVLATNSFFWRHTSTVQNANRGRSNAISRAFLCEDYLDRPIDFPKDVDLTDSEGIAEAIKTNPGCQACHATLDPFASHLWGFMQPVEDAPSWSFYHPENELSWQTETAAVPAFFGKPTAGSLRALALAIAGDERFVACTTRRMYEAFLGRPAALADEGQLAFHREAFLASGLSLKALVLSLFNDAAYRGQARSSTFGGTPEPVDAKLVSPQLLGSSLYDLSGYRMSYGGRDLISVDYGLRALAGGSERGASASPSLGRALVHRRLAEGAAQAVISQATPSSRIGALLSDADLAAQPSPETLVALLFEVQSVRPEADGEQVQALLSLWDAVASQQDAQAAWTALLTAVFSDPSLAVY